MKRLGRSGFTLLELLVVVIIIGILATIAIPAVQRAMEGARQAEARTQLGSMFQAEKLYFAEKQTYSKDPGVLFVSIPRDDSTDHYFTYTISAASATAFLITAQRKITKAGCRPPPWNLAYTITVDQDGVYTTGSY